MHVYHARYMGTTWNSAISTSFSLSFWRAFCCRKGQDRSFVSCERVRATTADDDDQLQQQRTRAWASERVREVGVVGSGRLQRRSASADWCGERALHFSLLVVCIGDRPSGNNSAGSRVASWLSERRAYGDTTQWRARATEAGTRVRSGVALFTGLLCLVVAVARARGVADGGSAVVGCHASRGEREM